MPLNPYLQQIFLKLQQVIYLINIRFLNLSVLNSSWTQQERNVFSESKTQVINKRHSTPEIELIICNSVQPVRTSGEGRSGSSIGNIAEHIARNSTQERKENLSQSQGCIHLVHYHINSKGQREGEGGPEAAEQGHPGSAVCAGRAFMSLGTAVTALIAGWQGRICSELG